MDLHFVAFAAAVAFAFKRLRKDPFEGPATVKLPTCRRIFTAWL